MYKQLLIKLNQLEKIYNSLLDSAIDKQAAIVGNENDRLVELSKQEELLISDAKRVEQERMQIARGIARINGMSTDEPALSELAKSAGESDRQQLIEAARALLDTLTALKQQNALNKDLLEINLSYTTFMLDMLTRRESPSSIYGASGSEQDYTLTRPTFFDSEI